MAALRPGQRVQFEAKCVSCLQPVFQVAATHAEAFGHIYSLEGMRLFIHEQTCEMCADILADFAVMHTRKDGA